MSLLQLVYYCFYLCAIFSFLLTEEAIAKKQTPQISHRIIQYEYILQNSQNKSIHNVKFHCLAPVKQMPNQFCKNIESNNTFQIQYDAYKNQTLIFGYSQFAPYESKVITIRTYLDMYKRILKNKKENMSIYLRSEPFIESNDSEIVKIALRLKKQKKLETARNILKFVHTYLTYSGYSSINIGAVKALKNKSGDCTEYMHLFVALCRAANIPARCIGGYICKGNRQVHPSNYHNWAEFYADGLWHIADPQKNVFCKHIEQYVAMKILIYDTDIRNEQKNFERFAVSDHSINIIMK